MKSRIFAVVVFGVTAAFAGCKKDVTKDIAKFADQACACKDAACGDAVLEQFIKFAGNNKDATTSLLSVRWVRSMLATKAKPSSQPNVWRHV